MSTRLASGPVRAHREHSLFAALLRRGAFALVCLTIALAMPSGAFAEPLAVDTLPAANATTCDPKLENDDDFLCLHFADPGSINTYVKHLEDLGWQTDCSGIYSCSLLSPADESGCQRLVSMYRGSAPDAPRSQSVMWMFSGPECIPVIDMPDVVFP